MDLTDLVRSAFLDQFGRFAKTEELVAVVRLWFAGDSPESYTDLTLAEYEALPEADRDTIKNTGSAAGFVETDGKSNA